MDRVPVDSSNVVAVGYDENSSTLEVGFKGGSVYRYFGVPTQHFHALSGGSVSVGRYLNTKVKPHYRCEQVAFSRRSMTPRIRRRLLECQLEGRIPVTSPRQTAL